MKYILANKEESFIRISGNRLELREESLKYLVSKLIREIRVRVEQKKKILIIVNSYADCNIVSRLGFYYNHNLFLSNYYKTEWYNPCPICFFGNLESSLRGKSKAFNTTSFQTLMDLIYKREPKFEIKNNFSNYSILLFVNTLLDELNYINNSHVNNVKYIDFNRNIVISDQSIHWELCDCYE